MSCLVHWACVQCRFRGCLLDLYQPNHRHQLHRALGLILKLPLAVLKPGILQFERAAREENRTLFQNAVDEPAFFQLKGLFGECLAFVFCDGHWRDSPFAIDL